MERRSPLKERFKQAEDLLHDSDLPKESQPIAAMENRNDSSNKENPPALASLQTEDLNGSRRNKPRISVLREFDPFTSFEIEASEELLLRPQKHQLVLDDSDSKSSSSKSSLSANVSDCDEPFVDAIVTADDSLNVLETNKKPANLQLHVVEQPLIYFTPEKRSSLLPKAAQKPVFDTQEVNNDGLNVVEVIKLDELFSSCTLAESISSEQIKESPNSDPVEIKNEESPSTVEDKELGIVSELNTTEVLDKNQKEISAELQQEKLEAAEEKVEETFVHSIVKISEPEHTRDKVKETEKELDTLISKESLKVSDLNLTVERERETEESEPVSRVASDIDEFETAESDVDETIIEKITNKCTDTSESSFRGSVEGSDPVSAEESDSEVLSELNQTSVINITINKEEKESDCVKEDIDGTSTDSALNQTESIEQESFLNQTNVIEHPIEDITVNEITEPSLIQTKVVDDKTESKEFEEASRRKDSKIDLNQASVIKDITVNEVESVLDKTTDIISQTKESLVSAAVIEKQTEDITETEKSSLNQTKVIGNITKSKESEEVSLKKDSTIDLNQTNVLKDINVSEVESVLDKTTDIESQTKESLVSDVSVLNQTAVIEKETEDIPGEVSEESDSQETSVSNLNQTTNIIKPFNEITDTEKSSLNQTKVIGDITESKESEVSLRKDNEIDLNQTNVIKNITVNVVESVLDKTTDIESQTKDSLASDLSILNQTAVIEKQTEDIPVEVSEESDTQETPLSNLNQTTNFIKPFNEITETEKTSLNHTKIIDDITESKESEEVLLRNDNEIDLNQTNVIKDIPVNEVESVLNKTTDIESQTKESLVSDVSVLNQTAVIEKQRGDFPVESVKESDTQETPVFNLNQTTDIIKPSNDRTEVVQRESDVQLEPDVQLESDVREVSDLNEISVVKNKTENILTNTDNSFNESDIKETSDLNQSTTLNTHTEHISCEKVEEPVLNKTTDIERKTEKSLIQNSGFDLSQIKVIKKEIEDIPKEETHYNFSQTNFEEKPNQSEDIKVINNQNSDLNTSVVIKTELTEETHESDLNKTKEISAKSAKSTTKPLVDNTQKHSSETTKTHIKDIHSSENKKTVLNQTEDKNSLDITQNIEDKKSLDITKNIKEDKNSLDVTENTEEKKDLEKEDCEKNLEPTSVWFSVEGSDSADKTLEEFVDCESETPVKEKVTDNNNDRSINNKAKQSLDLSAKTKQNFTDKNKLMKNMADLNEKVAEYQQEISDIKLKLNAAQQANASLELEIRQKEEIIIKTQAEALKKEQEFRAEIKELKETSKLIEKGGSKELEEALKEAKEKIAYLTLELANKNKEKANHDKIMAGYESSLSARTAKYEKLKEEHETIGKHLANLEFSFSDVHQKYERSKAVVEGFRANVETLKMNLLASEKNARNLEERYESLKSHAKNQIERSNKDYLTQRKQSEEKELQMCARIKRLEIKCKSLEVSLEQKTNECTQLAALCDEVTGKNM